MRIEARIFILVGVFLGLAAAGYAWWTWATQPGGMEAVGTVCILLSAGLCAIITDRVLVLRDGRLERAEA